MHCASHNRGLAFWLNRLRLVTVNICRLVLCVPLSSFSEWLLSWTSSLSSKLSTVMTECPPYWATCRLFVYILIISFSTITVPRFIFASFCATYKTTVVLCPPILIVTQTTTFTLNVMSPAALMLASTTWSFSIYISGKAFSRINLGSASVSRIAITVCTSSSQVEVVVITL